MSTPLPRTAFPVASRWAYLDHAGIAPLPQPTVRAITACADAVAADGRLAALDHARRLDAVRRDAASLMGVDPDEVAFVKNTTEGLSLVAGGLAWSPGDRVVAPERAFPSVLFPWLALRDRGVVVDLVAPASGGGLPLEHYAEAIAAGPPPRVVVASWVHYASGWRTDLAGLAGICREVGALLCVDAIQGLGVLPAAFGAWGVDFAATAAHKWLLGPQGAGVLYVRASRLDLLRPGEPGWNSVRQRGDWEDLRLDYDPTARRLEGGTLAAAALLGLGASLQLLLDAGAGAVWAHVQALNDRACTGLEAAGVEILSDRSAAARSGIVIFSVPGTDPATVVEHLREHGVVVVPRGGGVRLAPHGYNTAEEIGTLVAAVGTLAG